MENFIFCAVYRLCDLLELMTLASTIFHETNLDHEVIKNIPFKFTARVLPET